jgi:hypothetical protein
MGACADTYSVAFGHERRQSQFQPVPVGKRQPYSHPSAFVAY